MARPKRRGIYAFERRSQPLLARRLWWRRVFVSAIIAGLLIALALGIGIVGYHYLGGLRWIDAVLDASMILSGMGPMSPLTTDTGKLFAAVYALFSGLAFIGTTGILLAPWAHRLLHLFHADADAADETGETDESKENKKPGPHAWVACRRSSLPAGKRRIAGYTPPPCPIPRSETSSPASNNPAA